MRSLGSFSMIFSEYSRPKEYPRSSTALVSSVTGYGVSAFQLSPCRNRRSLPCGESTSISLMSVSSTLEISTLSASSLLAACVAFPGGLRVNQTASPTTTTSAPVRATSTSLLFIGGASSAR